MENCFSQCEDGESFKAYLTHNDLCSVYTRYHWSVFVINAVDSTPGTVQLLELDFLFTICICAVFGLQLCSLYLYEANSCGCSVTVTSGRSAALETQPQVHSSGNFPPFSSYRDTAGKTYSCPISGSEKSLFQDFFLILFTLKDIFQTGGRYWNKTGL